MYIHFWGIILVSKSPVVCMHVEGSLKFLLSFGSRRRDGVGQGDSYDTQGRGEKRGGHMHIIPPRELN